MGNETCGLCGCSRELRTLEKYHIVPVEITQSAGFPESKMVEVCGNCLKELNKWNRLKVRDMVYDARIKRFRARSPLEMIREYEASYRVFVEYKSGR